jgi:hypothetical protein
MMRAVAFVLLVYATPLEFALAALLAMVIAFPGR